MGRGEIFETQDGSHSIHSDTYGVSYHSKYGAIQESRHVFLKSGLHYRCIGKEEVSVLEIGFGTGLNAILTLLEAENKSLKIRYEAIEAYPITAEQARTLNYPKFLGEQAQSYFTSLHEMKWGQVQQISPYFTFQKHHQLFQDIDYQEAFDLIYFDAFAPNAQPELWEEPVLGKMYDALKQDGVLVTYCAKGVVKRTLKGLGFKVESIKGPPGKREMTRAIKV